MPELSPETWAQIRYEYEHTERPVADICAERGISDTTLRNRRRRWHWTPRRAPIPQEGPPALAAHAHTSPPPIRAANGGEGSGVGGASTTLTAEPPTPLRLADASRSDPPHRFAGGGMETAPRVAPGDDANAPVESAAAALAPRLQSAVARVLPAIEATLTKLTASPQRPRELEQTARALGALMRTLRELNALLAQQPARSAYDDDDFPEDIDAFRDELARRIDAFIASRGDEFGAAAPPAEESP